MHDESTAEAAAGEAGQLASTGPGLGGGPAATAPGARTGAGQERGRRAKDAILAAAIDCLLEDGYAATTTLRAQQRAGVSRGKLLHHFPSKQVLLASAVIRLMEERLDAAQTADLTGAPDEDDVPARARWAVRRMWESFFADNFWAAMEIWIAARTDADLAADLVEHERRVLRRVRESYTQMFGAVLAEAPGFARRLDLAFTSMRGMALTYTFSGRDHRTEPLLESWADMFLGR